MRSARPACVTAATGVAAADDRVARAGGDGLGHGQRAAGEGRQLERAHGAVPEDRARVGDARRVGGRGLGADVEPHPAGLDPAERLHVGLGVGRELAARRRRRPAARARSRALRRRARPPRLGLPLLALVQRVADREAVGGREREGHGAADQDGVGALGERLEHADLVGHLDAAGDHDERPLGRVQQAAERLELAPQQQPGSGRQQVRDALGRGVRAVRGAEGVVDVDVGELREGGREGRVVGRLAGVEAQVLEQQHVAVAQFGHGVLGDPPMQSPDHATRAPSRSARRSRTGSSDAAGSGAPFGRPRCAHRITRAPRSRSAAIVGSAARMRVSSAMTPSCSGTLKSTRQSTRRPATSSASRPRGRARVTGPW